MIAGWTRPFVHVLLKVASEEIGELLQKWILLAFWRLANAFLVEHLELEPDHQSSLVKVNVGLKETDRIDLLKARTGGCFCLCSALILVHCLILIGVLVCQRCSHELFPNHSLIMIFHLVEVIRLQVIHQDCKGSHDLS